MRNLTLFLLLSLFIGLTAPVAAEQEGEEELSKGGSGLPVPRFAALHADEVNLRTGPGTRYPIDWVYLRQGLPLEITAEFDIWRRVRDWEGSEGWVHKSALTGKRALIVTGGLRNIYKSDDQTSGLAAQVESGAIGHIVSCRPVWCKVKFDHVKGYMRKADFWGTYPNETFD